MMSPVPLLVTNSSLKTQTTATTTATVSAPTTTTNVLALSENLKASPTNMLNSNTTHKQMEQNISSNNNYSNNVVATTNSTKAKTQNKQQRKEMSSSASSTSSTSSSSSSFSCSTATSSKNVITSQCDSSSSNSSRNSDNNIKNECNQSGKTAIKTELDTSDPTKNINGQKVNDTTDPNDLQLSAMRQRPISLSTVNPHIICSLCFGYLIDATTIVECLHSFCHSCLIKHLRTEQYCPRCEMMINTAKPNIKPDTTLQAIVYKLVPSLYEKELMRKRAFYKDRPEEAAVATPEQRGDDTEHLIFSPSDYMSISLEYADIDELMKSNGDYNELLKPRYLQCPAMCTVAHLKKLVFGKFEINSNRFTIDIMYKVKTIVLLDHYTLMDVAYIYTWKRDAPMRFYFRVKQSLKPLIRVKKNLLTQPKKEAAPVVEEPKLDSPPKCSVQHEPTPSVAIIASINKILEPEEIKQENEAEVSSTTEISAPPLPEPKQFEIVQPQSSAAGSHETSLTDKLKITLVNKAIKDKTNYNDANSAARIKVIKEKKDNHKTSPSTSSQKDERKVENIKLKIDLSKQNSVTIINMSDPERKEIVKPVKPEKEWKVKTKKDKESSPKSSPKSSPHNDRKSKTPSPLTVPPLTIKAERISPLAKANTPSPFEDDDKKSQFLKSFALAPIKNLKADKLEAKSLKKEFTHSIVNKSIYNKDPLHISSASKRKSKEPVKAIVKKPKLSPPLATEDFKIKLPPIANSKPVLSPPTNVITSNTNKTLMPPPAAVTAMKPPSALPKKLHKPPQSKVTAAPPGSLTPHPMHGNSAGIQLAAPGSRTPIAKRFQPILPKNSRLNPFANIPSDVNKLLKDAGTEIKTIPKEPTPPKVYGPKSDTSQIMGPPSIPATTSKPQGSASNMRSNANVSSSSAKTAATGKNNSYLNLALFNASKSKGNEVPPGCRTPMYTPNSPIYSPSSPQYVPNYNIPTMPTYKYTPKPSNNGNSYLQNVLGSNNQMSSLFPTPPVKKDSNSNNSNSMTNNNNNNNNSSNSTNSRSEAQTPKRVYPFARSPSPIEDPPEKQLKVKSLLNSCNINIPSSLSITITREDGETSCNGATYPKHKSPVNNYIEILKLPDHPTDAGDSKRSSPPIQNTSNSLFPNPPVRRVASPPAPLNTAKQTNNSTQNGSNTTKSTPTTASQNLTNLKTVANNMNLLAKNQNISNKSPAAAGNNKAPATTTNKSPNSSSDKKTPSPEKRLNTSMAEQKSPSGGDSAAKKFRHILPRQITTSNTPSEVNPVKQANNGNVIGTYSSPSGVNVKIHSNKKVQPSKKSPGVNSGGQTNKLPQQPSIATPNGGTKAATKSAQTAKNNNNKTSTSPVLNANNTSKLPSTPNMPTLPPNLPPALTHPIQSLLPPHLAAAAACQNAAAGQAELSKFLKENLLRAQVQAAVANQSNMFYPYAANAAAAAQLGQFNPTMYNYQQAYIMDQLSRMQRAGNEAFSEYMQKLKCSMEANKSPAELLTQPQHPTKPSHNAKKVSSPKSLAGQNNPPNSASTAAAPPASSITNATKDHQTTKTK